MATKNAKQIETKAGLIDPQTGQPAAPTNAPEGKSAIDASTGKPANPSNSPVDAPASRDRITHAGAGEKRLGEPDKGIGAKTTPELPVVGHDSKDDFAPPDEDVAARDNKSKGKKKHGKGQVTYRFADGSTVSHEVDDVANPPRMVHDEHGEGELVEE